MGNHEVVGKGYVNIENSQMVSIGAIFSSKYVSHKAVKSMANSSVGCVVIYSQLSAYPGEMESFIDHLSTHRHLTSLRNKPQQKHPG